MGRNNVKICSKCKKEKSYSEFHAKAESSDGHSSWCKDCRKIYQDKIYPKKKIKDNERLSKNPNNFLKHWLCDISKKQSRHPVDNDITLDYLISLWNKQKGLCALTQQPMTHIKGKGRVYENVSVDRIDPSIHYKRGNLQLVCFIFNMWKGKLSNEGFKNFVHLAGEHSFSSESNHNDWYRQL